MYYLLDIHFDIYIISLELSSLIKYVVRMHHLIQAVAS